MNLRNGQEFLLNTKPDLINLLRYSGKNKFLSFYFLEIFAPADNMAPPVKLM